MLHRVATLLLRLLSLERGAILWVPSLLAATYLVLFGIHLAPRLDLFNRVTGLRVVVGPWSCAPGQEAERDRVLACMRRRLRQNGELAVMDSVRVARRLAGQPIADAEGFLHASRALNAHVCLTGTLESTTPELRVRLEAWEPRAMRPLLALEVSGSDALQVGRALADSVSRIAYTPHVLAASTP